MLLSLISSGCIVVKKLSLPKDEDSVTETFSVVTLASVPITCNYYVIGDTSVDTVRKRFAVSFVIPHRAGVTDDDSFAWGLLVVLDCATNAGVVIDTGLHSVSVCPPYFSLLT